MLTKADNLGQFWGGAHYSPAKQICIQNRQNRLYSLWKTLFDIWPTLHFALFYCEKTPFTVLECANIKALFRCRNVSVFPTRKGMQYEGRFII